MNNGDVPEEKIFRMRRGYALAALIAVTAVTAAACSTSAAGGRSTHSSTAVTPAKTATAPPSPAMHATSPAATANRPASSGPAASGRRGGSWCAGSQLRASVDPRHIPRNGTPAGKHGKTRHGVLVDFENTSSSPCTLFGYPGAAVVDTSGRQVQQANRTLRGPLGGLPAGQTHPLPVRLRPHGYSSALIEGADQQERGAAQAGCDAPQNPRILVTPPNTKTAVPFTVGWPQCYSFTVHPVRALPDPPR